jgi:hypothetical protein
MMSSKVGSYAPEIENAKTWTDTLLPARPVYTPYMTKHLSVTMIG